MKNINSDDMKVNSVYFKLGNYEVYEIEEHNVHIIDTVESMLSRGAIYDPVTDIRLVDQYKVEEDIKAIADRLKKIDKYGCGYSFNDLVNCGLVDCTGNLQISITRKRFIRLLKMRDMSTEELGKVGVAYEFKGVFCFYYVDGVIRKFVISNKGSLDTINYESVGITKTHSVLGGREAKLYSNSTGIYARMKMHDFYVVTRIDKNMYDSTIGCKVHGHTKLSSEIRYLYVPLNKEFSKPELLEIIGSESTFRRYKKAGKVVRV